MVHRTCMSSLRLAECHPGDGPGMKPIFDGVYINQILLQAQVLSESCMVTWSRGTPSPLSPVRFQEWTPFSSELLAEWPFKRVLKRGSIFIRRFLMKHFKCMEFTVVSLRKHSGPHTLRMDFSPPVSRGPFSLVSFFNYSVISNARLDIKKLWIVSLLSLFHPVESYGTRPRNSAIRESFKRARIYTRLIKLRFHLGSMKNWF